MGKKLDKWTNSIPYWVYNIVGLVSGIIGIVSPVLSAVAYAIGKYEKNTGTTTFFCLVIVGYVAILIVLTIRVRKYQAVSRNIMRSTAEGYSRFLKDARDTFFDVVHQRKARTLNIHLLDKEVKDCFQKNLDELCGIMKSFTGEEVSACIKVVLPKEDGEEITWKDAMVQTFARSTNTDSERNNYDIHLKKQYVKDNSDFLDILNPDSDSKKSYFYKRSLIEYEKEQKKNGKVYLNSTPNWENYYRSTIVVPIRIHNEKISYSKKNGYYHVIGFVCVDSMSENAFLEKQEKYNVDVVKSFAAEAYIILSRYQLYMKKIIGESQRNVKKNN